MNVQCLRFALWNAHSVNSKDTSTALCDFVITPQLDVLAITETWLTGVDRDNRTLADIKNTLPNYVLYHSPRLHSRAGGVGILVRNGITVNIHQSQEYRAFEHVDLTLSSMSLSFHLLVIYRPPPNKKNKLTNAMFHDDFGCLTESLIAHPCRFLVAGDFNIHMDAPDNREAAIFRDLFDTSNFKQHVASPTHTAGHTLDLLITNNTDDFISSVSTHHDLPSDHAAVKCLIMLPAHQRQLRNYALANFVQLIWLLLNLISVTPFVDGSSS